MGKLQESVLYYHGNEEKGEREVRLLKSVLIRMGVRIKNIRPEQTKELVGYLAGLPGFMEQEQKGEGAPAIHQDILVMQNFTSARIDALLLGLRKAGGAKGDLKAVLTPQNAQWTFYHLYEELLEEHEKLAGK